MSDNWQFWRDSLAGNAPDAHPDHPQAGFYRMASRSEYGGRKTFTPVAYYYTEDSLNGSAFWCRIGDKDIPGDSTLALETWPRVCNRPVTEEAYRRVAQDGGAWPDEHEAVPMQGHNKPPLDDSFEGLLERVNDLSIEAERRLKGPPIADQAEADRIANLADRLAELWNKAEDQRKAGRKPHEDALKAIQARWLPLLTAAEVYKKLKYVLLTPFFLAQQRLAKQAQEEAAAAGEPIPAPKRQRAGTRGRAMSLKSTKRAEIVDYEVALQAVKDNDDVRAAVQAIANRAARAGVPIPGTKIVEEETVV